MKSRDEWWSPQSLSSLIPIQEGCEEALADALEKAGNQVGKQVGIRPQEINQLHFLRIQVLGDPHSEYDPVLLFNAVYDGPLSQFLESLQREAGAWLEGLLTEFCRSGQATLGSSLMANRLEEDAVYMGQLGAELVETRREVALLEFLQGLADVRRSMGEWGAEAKAEEIRLEMRVAVLAAKGEALPAGPRAKLTFWTKVRCLLDASRAVADPFSGLLSKAIRDRFMPAKGEGPEWKRTLLRVGLWLHSLYTEIPTRWFLNRIQKAESAETYEPLKADPQAVIDQMKREDVKTQNPLTLTAQVHEGRFRRWALGRILKGSGMATKHLWNQASLAGISTIHYARIFQFEEGKRFLFLSDYDGSWDRYLGDFLSTGSLAVVPIFGNLRGCPKTERLFKTTPRFGPRFLDFTRFSMMPVQFWYSAWPDLSLVDRLRNARIRDGLFRDRMSEAEALEWLANF